MSDLSEFKDAMNEYHEHTAEDLKIYQVKTESRLTRLEILIWIAIILAGLGDILRFIPGAIP